MRLISFFVLVGLVLASASPRLSIRPLRPSAALLERTAEGAKISRARSHEASGRTELTLEYLETAHATLRENLPADTTVGYLSVVDGDSQHNFDDHEYYITSGEDDWYIGGDNNNELKAKFSADYETQTLYSLKVKAVDTTHVDGTNNELVEDFQIQIIDENDVAPTNVELSHTTIDEGLSLVNGHQLIGTVTWEDTDTENDYTFHFGGDDASYFTFEGNGAKKLGYLYATEVFDYDSDNKNSYEVTVTIDDGEQSTSTPFTISINNVNDEAPTDCVFDPATLYENNEIGEVVGAFSWTDTDPDGGDNEVTLTDRNGFFYIEDNVVKMAKSLDYETDGGSFSISISVDDGANTVLTCEYDLELTDLNDNAPQDFALYPGDNSDSSLIVLTVEEGSDKGTLIAKSSFSDADRDTATDAQYFTLSFLKENSDTDMFEIVASDTNIYDDTGYWSIKVNGDFDYETQTVYTFSLALSDGEYDHVHYVDVQVNVEDINDSAPTSVSLDTPFFKETISAGDVVGSVTFDDADGVDGGYDASISDTASADGSSTGDADNFKLVKVDDKKYDIVVADGVSFDYNDQNVFEISVTVTDGKNEVTQEFNIIMEDENTEGPTEMSISDTTLDENEEAGTKVGSLTFTDMDNEETNEFTHKITNQDGSDDEYFTIGDWSVDGNTYTAALKSAIEFDFESQTSYDITWTVHDGDYENSLSFTVNIADLNDNLPTDIVLTQNDAAGVPISYPDNLGSRTIGDYPTDCDGSLDSPCALIYLDDQGNDVSLWAVDVGNDSTGRYPGWTVVCPATLIHIDEDTSCKDLEGDDVYTYINPEYEVYAQTAFCSDSDYAEYYADGVDNDDYYADPDSCQTVINVESAASTSTTDSTTTSRSRFRQLTSGERTQNRLEKMRSHHAVRHSHRFGTTSHRNNQH